MSYKIGDQLRIDILPRKLTLALKGDYAKKADTEISFVGDSTITNAITQSFEGELKYTLTSKISCAVLGRYESSYDETISSSENYTAMIGGFHLTYLF